MKYAWIALWVYLFAGPAGAEILIKQLDLTGHLAESELVMTMEFEARVDAVPARMVVLEGAVLPTQINLPRGVELVLEDGIYYLNFSRKGKQSISMEFEAKVLIQGQRRWSAFGLPPATIRKLICRPKKRTITLW